MRRLLILAAALGFAGAAYGQEIKLFKFGRMPAQVLVDRAGRARFVHYGHDMSDIPSNVEILELVDGLNAEHARSA